MTMNPPPPGPATNGSVTPSVLATATAASTALPPALSVAMPALLALNSADATAPPVPVATGCLTYCGPAFADGAPRAATSTQAAAVEVSGRARMEHPKMLSTPGFQPYSADVGLSMNRTNWLRVATSRATRATT